MYDARQFTMPEIAMQRGYFTYFVVNREEVFEDAYGQSLRLLLERDENDAQAVDRRCPVGRRGILTPGTSATPRTPSSAGSTTVNN